MSPLELCREAIGLVERLRFDIARATTNQSYEARVVRAELYGQIRCLRGALEEIRSGEHKRLQMIEIASRALADTQ